MSGPQNTSDRARVRFLTEKWEAAENYLWVQEGGLYNVVAIFGNAEECSQAAAALNAYKPPDQHSAKGEK